MAKIKISELNAKTTAADNDLIPIVDTINSETKKITAHNLLGNTFPKNNIVTVSGDATVEPTQGLYYQSAAFAIIPYPDGFNTNNCYVISCRLHNDNEFYNDKLFSLPLTNVTLSDGKISGFTQYEYYSNGIGVYYYGNDFFNNDELTFQLLLMKVDD